MQSVRLALWHHDRFPPINHARLETSRATHQPQQIHFEQKKGEALAVQAQLGKHFQQWLDDRAGSQVRFVDRGLGPSRAGKRKIRFTYHSTEYLGTYIDKQESCTSYSVHCHCFSPRGEPSF